MRSVNNKSVSTCSITLTYSQIKIGKIALVIQMLISVSNMWRKVTGNAPDTRTTDSERYVAKYNSCQCPWWDTMHIRIPLHVSGHARLRVWGRRVSTDITPAGAEPTARKSTGPVSTDLTLAVAGGWEKYSEFRCLLNSGHSYLVYEKCLCFGRNPL